MILLLIGVLAGAVTAVSPCVLPVLPVIFFGAGSATGPGFGHPVGAAAGSTNDDAPPRERRGGAGLIVLGLVLSFALLTLAGSVLVDALHLPTGVLRWAGLIVVFLAGSGRWYLRCNESCSIPLPGYHFRNRPGIRPSCARFGPGNVVRSMRRTGHRGRGDRRFHWHGESGRPGLDGGLFGRHRTSAPTFRLRRTTPSGPLLK